MAKTKDQKENEYLESLGIDRRIYNVLEGIAYSVDHPQLRKRTATDIKLEDYSDFVIVTRQRAGRGVNFYRVIEDSYGKERFVHLRNFGKGSFLRFVTACHNSGVTLPKETELLYSTLSLEGVYENQSNYTGKVYIVQIRSRTVKGVAKRIDSVHETIASAHNRIKELGKSCAVLKYRYFDAEPDDPSSVAVYIKFANNSFVEALYFDLLEMEVKNE